MIRIQILNKNEKYEVYLGIDKELQQIAEYTTAGKAMIKALKLNKEIPGVRIQIDQQTAEKLHGLPAGVEYDIEVFDVLY